ncbi:MAG: hypothetical protein AB1760_00400 [Pseudomonadota bacterium]
MAQQITLILDELAKRFGATAEHLWAVMVKQQVVRGGVDLAVAGFFLLLLVAACVAEVWAVRHDDGLHDASETVGTAALLVGIPSLFLFVTAAAYGTFALLNPEYYALQSILRALGR